MKAQLLEGFFFLDIFSSTLVLINKKKSQYKIYKKYHLAKSEITFRH